MRGRNILGLALALAGAALLGVLFYPSFAHSLKTGSLYTTSMPGALLLGLTAIIVFVFGIRLMLARQRPNRQPNSCKALPPGAGDAPIRRR